MKHEGAATQEVESDSLGHNQSNNEGQGRPNRFQLQSLRLISFLDTVATTSKGAISQHGETLHTPPKADKPRPHACTTCGRSFVRLEHLRRHERSHTKEKPFECVECTRCFARKDLLLRHQHKLHAIKSTPSLPRASRRKSVSGATASGGNRARKSSVANNGNGRPGGLGANSVRPRANTISHIDLSTFGLMDMSNANPATNRTNPLGLCGDYHHSASMSGMPDQMGSDYRGISIAMDQDFNIGGVPKFDTYAVNSMDVGNSLRAAPAVAGFSGVDLDPLFNPRATINPAQLHFGGIASKTSKDVMMPQMSPFQNSQSTIEEHDDFRWMRNWTMRGMSFCINGNENAVDESSPSRISSGDRPGDFSKTSNIAVMPIRNGLTWSQQCLQPQSPLSAGPSQMQVLGADLPKLDAPRTMSPSSMLDSTPTADKHFHQMIMQRNMQQQAQRQTQYHQAPSLQQEGGHGAQDHLFHFQGGR